MHRQFDRKCYELLLLNLLFTFYIYTFVILEVRIWNRDTTKGQTVQNALAANGGTNVDFCPEYQGEAIAIKYDNSGFYTTTELDANNISHKFAPIYYYKFPQSFSDGNFKQFNILQVFACSLVVRFI